MKKKKQIVDAEVQDIVSTETDIDVVNIAEPIEVLAEKIKKKLGLKEIFITTIADQDIIWRKLKRSEYREIMTTQYNENKDLDYYEREEDIARKVILYPENVEEILEDFAGIADTIAGQTMLKTGFGVNETKTV